MAFKFENVGQEIEVWYLLNKKGFTYETNINKLFFDAVVNGEEVELNDGEVSLVTKGENTYEGEAFVVFRYNDETYRMDIDEYDSWDEDSDVSEPYVVIPVPVNEVQYIRRRS